jgi:hypothetical protein
VRLSAAVALLLLLAYHGLRIAASQCAGLACDWYIPLSLVVPIAIVVAVAVAGIVAFPTARRAGASSWAAGIAIATGLGVAGPPIALAVFRDSPDVLVPIATVLWLLGPVCVLAFSVFRDRTPAQN